MKQDIVNGFFINDFLLSTRFCEKSTLFLTEKYFTLSTITQCDHLNFLNVQVVFSSLTFCIKCKRQRGHLEIKILPSLDRNLGL